MDAYFNGNFIEKSITKIVKLIIKVKETENDLKWIKEY